MMTVDESYARCHDLTREHYENFPVARLVPKAIRPYVSAVYAFARTADDLADEGWGQSASPTPQERVTALDAYEEQLVNAAEGRAVCDEYAWIFLAVADTMKKTGAPLQLFRDLLSAFKQDCVKLRYETFDEVLDYCRRSANPVGRLVLILHGHADEQKFAWSDQICSALQLANFWQDVSIDIKKDGRVYIPLEDWATYGVTEEMFSSPPATEQFRRCMQFQVERTYAMFKEGRVLSRHLPFPLSMEIRITWLGGQTILDKIIAANYDTVSARPKINAFDKVKLLQKAAFTR
ncbi:squalene synthase HpnC [Ruficoccus sp. ZRK36]|uniref:squalene synthase HpnC n=1 Tax=Ruficoccus sp. ZRK36 TaxID=2866311 RepID=UPI001C73BE83|nr:squalene synthase HpnC [Ruficoccus sp. ZRK36]QYY37174.1 squalene synthase HpnC [Ruficoccus sp. ZRK36]